MSTRATAVQVNWAPPRPITDRERELLTRTMYRAAASQMAHWDGEGHEPHKMAEIASDPDA